MSKKDLSQSVLDKIKKDHIKPKSKWAFLLKDYVFWGLFAICIIIGGMVASMMIFKLTIHDWEMHKPLGENFFRFHLRALPLFWILLLTGFIFVADYNFKHTKKGYKYSLPLVMIGTILASIILGFALFGAGVAKRMDEKALQHLPFYKEMTLDQRLEDWSQVEKGLIGGEIIKINEDKVEIKSFKGEIWEVNTDMVPKEMLDKLEEGMIIGGFGKKGEKGMFDADKIKPWKGNFINMKENEMFLRTI